MEAKIDSILEKLESSQHKIQSALESKISSLREEYTWFKEGNKIQYNFNAETIQCLQHVVSSIRNETYTDAESMIETECERLKLRNKHIRIADSSEGGWETVRQYVSNELADNSDDDRAIFRANTRAVRKIPQKRGRYSPYGGRGTRRGATVTRPVQQVSKGSNGPQHVQSFNQPFRPRGRRTGACFSCGEFTHFRRECPYTSAGSQGVSVGSSAGQSSQ